MAKSSDTRQRKNLLIEGNWGSEFGSGEAEKALTYELTAALTRAQQLDQGQGGGLPLIKLKEIEVRRRGRERKRLKKGRVTASLMIKCHSRPEDGNQRRRLNGLAYADEIKKRACSALTSNWVKPLFFAPFLTDLLDFFLPWIEFLFPSETIEVVLVLRSNLLLISICPQSNKQSMSKGWRKSKTKRKL
ncbi:hypothetical protein Salat_2973400 [Sesamum alatum]|uniref:Uncharacterized protein n=1 Tax=Sesamum alatum TaxID=300844 RepID=A0AAE1XHJ3_9LAMI|nr:hypothetical protein Salat_2973400 [Sesamum alatum]